MHRDVVIVGGGPAGLSAALILARARRRVLVCDIGRQRNRRSGRIGGFLTRDGTDPADLLRISRDELRSYETVELRENTEIVDAEPWRSGFRLRTEGGDTFFARKVLVATGVTDVLPEVPGIEDFYGRSVSHCPYCDGYELRDRRVAVYGSSKSAFALALELTGWTRQLVLVSDGPSAADRPNAAAWPGAKSRFARNRSPGSRDAPGHWSGSSSARVTACAAMRCSSDPTGRPMSRSRAGSAFPSGRAGR